MDDRIVGGSALSLGTARCGRRRQRVLGNDCFDQQQQSDAGNRLRGDFSIGAQSRCADKAASA
jgi:hypothetical protein